LRIDIGRLRVDMAALRFDIGQLRIGICLGRRPRKIGGSEPAAGKTKEECEICSSPAPQATRYSVHGQPWAKRLMKQVKSSTFRTGAMVEPSQLA
jgi:hypothetical protein